MNTGFIITAITVSYCAVLALGQEDDVGTAWLKYQTDFPGNGARQTMAEILIRIENFAKVDAMIEKHNQNSHATFKMDHNKFSTMDDDEKKLYTGLRLPMDVNNSGGLALIGRSSGQLPDSLDYRNHNCMPAVKDQGQCGSCWAFAAITPLEFARCKKTNESVLLSEQQLVDCDPSNLGCSGGWYSSAWNYLQNGSAKESFYPYTGQDMTCKFKTCMNRVKVASSGFLERNNPVSMQMALQLYGPISVAFTVTDSFYAYRSGIYNDPACDNKGVNHAVVVVGWGTQNEMDYWIVRNSWGNAWGDSGYFLMQRGVNKCNIENFAAAITSII
ncbi:uncharacterized protein LOC130703755 [Daphnia carinata]|uniref:uncharacterized protein LOC130703755 n=1 Tax=Daphnia carinata TaxID=120202 RepID=UPI00257FFA24|nr:uncharacterized protein LOC130703755 [Daphnia carinata]